MYTLLQGMGMTLESRDADMQLQLEQIEIKEKIQPEAHESKLGVPNAPPTSAYRLTNCRELLRTLLDRAHRSEDLISKEFIEQGKSRQEYYINCRYRNK